ncbi:RNA polymerase sigma-70 factor [Mucilaginibacter gynuensis]|uniref:RNA polymerase sigma-70 factor n=1 Tax=Mucilaginibacter gynuensis TaxID=1302236 RepID=A0ABP8G5R5_9SPHI
MTVSSAIIANLKQGDADAFSYVFDQYWQQLFRAAYKRVADDQLAQDIVQDVFLQLWDRRETLNMDSETLEFYLLRAVRNKVIDHYNSTQVKEDVLQKIMYRMETMSQDNHDLKRYLELEEFVNDHIDTFPETMRAVFLMRSDKFTVRQIALALNLAEQTVKNNITEATKRLRAALSKKFSDEEFIAAFIIASVLTKI